MDALLKQKMVLIVRALYFCMEKNWAQLEKEYHLSPAQQHILFLLSTNQHELTPTELSELGCWHISTVTRLLKPLQEKDFITVAPNPKQPRFKIVKTTEKGKEIIGVLMDAARNLEQFPFSMKHVKTEEIERFLEYGQKILDEQKGNAFMNLVENARVEGYEYM